MPSYWVLHCAGRCCSTMSPSNMTSKMKPSFTASLLFNSEKPGLRAHAHGWCIFLVLGNGERGMRRLTCRLYVHLGVGKITSIFCYYQISSTLHTSFVPHHSTSSTSVASPEKGGRAAPLLNQWGH